MGKWGLDGVCVRGEERKLGFGGWFSLVLVWFGIGIYFFSD